MRRHSDRIRVVFLRYACECELLNETSCLWNNRIRCIKIAFRLYVIHFPFFQELCVYVQQA
jgi:hypothetical protein